ncbi:hypothetical protein FY528_08090 [Hymenobacter lutimineralis]|uniref:UspA domain-containing protein n=1 Tax=Hymenobacter lutimineralis TaxID=2606448 RepID=A0A5D6V6R7_9BACT|nr:MULTISPECIES: universal stress protein [Hymenobacter]QIX62844.1 universal stress protein [Hymenobacter sp. BT18]TYZ11000.1 hypothetical protein FY528_08090 [Hymenobacter lutimineralis]
MAAPLLVLTDFSPAADQALAYAAALAAHLNTSLVLLHVRRTSWLDPETFSGKIPHLSEGEIAAALALRTAAVQVPVRVEVASAQMMQATREVIAHHQPQLLVVGKPDSEAIPDPLVHTTSLDLLRECRLPLLIVPVGSTAAVPPRAAVLSADDYPVQLPAAIAALPRQLLAPDAVLTLVHVVEPEESDSCATAHTRMLQAGILTGFEQVRPRGVRHLEVAVGIREAAHDAQADLLLLLARRRSVLGSLFHRSITADVIRHATLPVLALPATE